MKKQTPVVGVVLAGGHSRRMGRDKASIVYPGRNQPQWSIVAHLLAQVCGPVYVSVRKGQVLPVSDAQSCSVLYDEDSYGPLSGILAAMSRHPNHAVLAVACDLPLLSEATLTQLLASRGEQSVTAYRSAHDGLPEPLCAVYEPSFFPILNEHSAAGRNCPRKILINESAQVLLLDLAEPNALDNANTPDDFSRLATHIKT